MLPGFTARFDNLKNNLLALSKRKSFRYGLPFVLFVVGGSFGLREWTQIRHEREIMKMLIVRLLEITELQQTASLFAYYGASPTNVMQYQFSKVKGVSKEEAEKMGLHKEKKVTLEDTYEEIQKLDIDNWENKRGPRPWEGNLEAKKK